MQAVTVIVCVNKCKKTWIHASWPGRDTDSDGKWNSHGVFGLYRDEEQGRGGVVLRNVDKALDK